MTCHQDSGNNSHASSTRMMASVRKVVVLYAQSPHKNGALVRHCSQGAGQGAGILLRVSAMDGPPKDGAVVAMPSREWTSNIVVNAYIVEKRPDVTDVRELL